MYDQKGKQFVRDGKTNLSKNGKVPKGAAGLTTEGEDTKRKENP